MLTLSAENFSIWRDQVKQLLNASISPEQVLWVNKEEQGLFTDSIPISTLAAPEKPITVPKNFHSLSAKVSCYRDVEKWVLLYRALWRLKHKEPHLLKLSTDNDVLKLRHMAKQVNRDAHKMKAFVRFRQVGDNEYVAWHEPVHLIVAYTAPFFVRRFNAMKWTILTPDASAIWNGESLNIGPGVDRSAAPTHDEMEDLWKTFYRNIFNPARIKTKMMKSEMPVRYWHTMPETALIGEMLEEADKRVAKMIEDNK